MLRLTSLEGNTQWLDGGAMFGSVPRALWTRWAVPDEHGRICLAARSFLVEDGERRILLEAGVGAFFEPMLKTRFGIEPEHHVLLESLADAGVTPAEIDVVVLSHLHFDHAGGLVTAYEAGKPLELVFPQARFVVSDGAWRRALAPHPRDRASYIPEILGLLEASGRLDVLRTGEERSEICGPRLRFRRSEGHTPDMLIPVLEGQKQRAVFCADLIPGTPWVHLPVTAGYDRFPERLIDEKQSLYEEESAGRPLQLLFTHDSRAVAGRLGRDERRRYCVEEPLERLRGYELD